MVIELTPKQQEMLAAAAGQLPSVLDPRTNTRYALVPLAGQSEPGLSLRFQEAGRREMDNPSDEADVLTDPEGPEEMPPRPTRTVVVQLEHIGRCPVPSDEGTEGEGR